MDSESRTFKRFKLEELKGRLQSHQSFLIFGPRQTGKSTLLEDIFSQLPQHQVIKYYFQLPSVREKIEEDTQVILREVEARGLQEPAYVLIDEIQKVPKVMDVLQYLIDQKKIVLAASGSSARKMRVLGTNWLPGRIHLDYLYPLTWVESGALNAARPLEEYLLYGALPGILSHGDFQRRQEDLASYSHLYLEEEIRMEAMVRNLPRFTKFLRLAALESGTAPNCSKIGTQIGVSHITVRGYFQILEDTLITHWLEAFGDSRDQVLRSAKYYFFDIGVRNAAAQMGHYPGILTLQKGILFEHWVVLEMMARLKTKARLSYWRTKQGHEVDLIIETGGKRSALEIKATEKPLFSDFKALELFRKKYPCDQTLLVCQIDRSQKFGDHFAIPWQEIWERLS